MRKRPTDRGQALSSLGPLIAAILILSTPGCGPGHGMNLGRVSGKVVIDGQPVKYGTVFFVPDVTRGTDGPSSMAAISSDGTYSLSTDSPGDGALVGHHKVGIVALDPTPLNPEKVVPTPEEAPLDVMKAKAGPGHQGKGAGRSAKAAGSPTAAKTAAGKETFTDRGGRVFVRLLPARLGNPEDSGIRAEVQSGSNHIDFQFKGDGTPVSGE